MRGVNWIAVAGILRPLPFHRRNTRRLRRVLLLLTMLCMLCWTANAHADWFPVGGVELNIPDGGNGWGLRGGRLGSGTYSSFLHGNGASRIDVFRVEQVPPAETQAFAKWWRELKAPLPTAEVAITNAAEYTQRGVKGVKAEGTAKDDTGKALRLRIIVLPLEDGAVVGRAVLREDDAEKVKQEMEEVLKSMGPTNARPDRLVWPALDPALEVRAGMMVGVLEEEAARLGREGKEKAATELSAKVKRWQDELAGRELAPRAEPELHLVGVNEGLFPNGPKKFGTVKVQVEIKDSPVVLAMCAMKSVRWELMVGEGVRLQRIILMGSEAQEVVGAPMGVPVERHDKGSPGSSPPYIYAYQEGEKYKQVQEALLTLTGLPVSTFTGISQAPEAPAPIVLGLASKDWRFRRMLSEAEGEYLQATALDRAQRRESIKSEKYEALAWQPQGPMGTTASVARFEGADVVKGSVREFSAGSQVAVDPSGPTYYGISGQQLVRVDLERKTQTAMPIPAELPKLTLPGGITFDPKRRRLLIADQAGSQGLLYSYEPDKNRWSLLRERNFVRLASVSYSIEEDCIYGFVAPTENSEGVIHRFSADGAWEDRTLVPKRLPVERVLFSTTQVVSVGANPAVLWVAGEEMRVMVIEWKNKTVLYEGPVRMRAEIADEELQQMWEQLGAAPEAQATELVTRMASAGHRVVELIQKLPPVQVLDDQTLRGLIAKLDAEQFRERDAATLALRRAGEDAVKALKDALAAPSLSLEARTRIESLLKEIDVMDLAKFASPELRREIRAMRVLGEVRNIEAVRALREFATEGGMRIRARAAREALRAM